MRYGISIASIPLEKKAHYARMAEDAGFELVVTNDNRGDDCFVAMSAMAIATNTIGIGSGICRAFVRTPVATASAAYSLDHLSGGRLVLSLGGGTRRQRDYGIEIEHGAPRMRELIEIMRLLWANHPRLFEYRGQHYQLEGDAPGAHPMGRRFTPEGRQIPIYIAIVREAMTRLMGEIANGSAGHPCWHKGYIDKIVMPNLAAGLRRSGRQRKDFDLTCWRIVQVARNGVDRKAARREAARHLATYLQVRSYSVLLDSVGWHREKEAIYDAGLRRRDQEALVEAISDEIIDSMAITGTPDEVRKQAKQYEGLLDRIILHDGEEANIATVMEIFGS